MKEDDEVNDKQLLTEQYILEKAGQEKVDYLKSINLEWKDVEFPNCIGGFVGKNNSYIYISGFSIINDSLEEIKNTLE